MKKIAIAFAVLVAFLSFALAAEKKANSKNKETSGTATTEHKMLLPSDIKWVDGPPSLPPGAKMAVLDGDPGKKGLFTIRLQSPAGYKIPPHTHPMAERITVISGAVRLGMGDKFDEAAGPELVAGSFAVMPAGMKHFASNASEAVVQIHSEGPFEIKYVNPADDPRTAKK